MTEASPIPAQAAALPGKTIGLTSIEARRRPEAAAVIPTRRTPGKRQQLTAPRNTGLLASAAMNGFVSMRSADPAPCTTVWRGSTATPSARYAPTMPSLPTMPTSTPGWSGTAVTREMEPPVGKYT